mgnify:FL=1
MYNSIRLPATCLLVLFISFAGRAFAQTTAPWLLVDTSELRVTVMSEDDVVTVFENIAIGSNGATRDKQVGDERTPLGEYRITEIRDSRRFYRFMALDYPSLEDAVRALDDGRIDERDYARIRQAWRRGIPPPQNTPLGGHLGLHGLGNGNPDIHERFNWTNGCIALTNNQVDELTKLIAVGTRVSIR